MSESLPTELERLHAYVDGELPPAERARVEAYLAEHREQAKRVEDYQRIATDLKQLYGGVAEVTKANH